MAKQQSAQTKVLQIIYTFFIGILLALFVGVGIAAFYPKPKAPEYPTPLKIRSVPVEVASDTTASAELEEEQIKYDRQFEVYQEERELYNRNVSIIALVAAVIILVVSLTMFKQLQVIADGLLLGGVITLLYSVVRVFGSGDDKVRFIIVGIGLAVALVLGYKKFISRD